MLPLPENLTIHNVTEFKEQLLCYLDENKEKEELVLDAAALRDMDAAGLQLILSLCKALLRKKISLAIANRSPFIERLFKLSGSDDILDRGGNPC